MLPYEREIEGQALIVFGKHVVDTPYKYIPRGYVQICLNFYKLYGASFHYPWAYSNHKGQEKL